MKKSRFSLLRFAAGAVGVGMALRRENRSKRRAIEQLKPGAARAKSVLAKSGRVTKSIAERTLPSGARDATANAPEEITPQGWWDVIKRSVVMTGEHELLTMAASVTFYALLSLFPALTAIVSVYGLFADPSSISSHVQGAAGILPGGGVDIITQQITRVAQSPRSGLSVGLAGGLLVAIWSANQGAKAMLSALNKAYGKRETRGFLKLTLVSLSFTVASIVITLLGASLLVVLPLVFSQIGLASAYNTGFAVLRWPVIVVALTFALALLYRFGPDRRPAKWRWVTWGGVVATLGWLAISYAFSWYVSHFGSYNRTYGSLGAVVGFMTWIWLSSTVLLFGAQVNAELEAQTERRTTT